MIFLSPRMQLATPRLRTSLVTLVIAALAPVFALVIYISIQGQDASLRSAEHELLVATKLAALGKERSLEGARHFVDAIASIPAIRRSDRAQCAQYFENLSGRLTAYSNAGVVDLNGDVVCQAAAVARPANLADRDYFREVVAKESFAIGSYALGRMTGRPGLVFAGPIYDPANKLVGIAFAALDLQTMAAYSSIDVPTGARLLVTDRNNVVVAGDGSQSARLGTPFTELALTDRTDTAARVFEQPGPAGRTYLYATATVQGGSPTPGLFVTTTIGKDAILKDAQERLALSLALLTLLTGAGVAVARWIGARTIVAPMRRLVDQVNELGGSDLAARKSIALPETSNELIELSDAFHRLTEALQARKQERDHAAELLRIQIDQQLVTQKELSATVQKLTDAQRQAHLGSWEVTLADQRSEWSDEVFRIFGIKRADFGFSYQAFLALVHPDDRAALDAVHHSSILNGLPVDHEHRIVRPNGEIRHVRERGAIVYDQAGAPVALTGTILDITDLRGAQSQADTASQLLSVAHRVADMGSWDMDVVNHRLHFSPEACHLFGMDPDAFDGRYETYFSSILFEDRALVLHAQKRGVVEKKMQDVEYRILRPDGEIRWMYERGNLTFDKAGKEIRRTGMVMDITERKQREAQLSNSRVLLGMASRVGRLGAWQFEVPGGVLTWSEEMCVIHDLPPDYQPVLDEGLDFYLPECREKVRRLFDLCVTTGASFDGEFQIETASGSRIWVRAIGEAVRDDSGVIIRAQGALQDISHLKAAEARERRLTVQLTSTLESTTDGFYLLDRNWNFTAVNAQAERMFKRDRTALLGKNVWNLFPETPHSVFGEQLRRVMDKGEVCRFEAPFVPLKTLFDVQAYPVEDGIAVYFQDITQKRIAEEQLRLLDVAVSRLNDMVLITDAGPIGEPGPRIVYVNDAFVRRTGYSREEVIGHSPRILQGPATERAELDRIRQAMAAWQPIRTELLNYTKGGEEMWVELDIVPLVDGLGRHTHWVSVERDITERKQIQDAMHKLNQELEDRVTRRTAQLQAVNAELEAFSYSVSHDLRSPLNAIDGFSHLLVQSDGDRLSEKGQHYVNRIRAGAKNMAQLIDGLLSLAKSASDPLRHQDVDLALVARRIEQECRDREPARDVKVVIPASLMVRGDFLLLSVVMHNLLTNAWKFTAKQAHPRIEVGSEKDPEGNTFYFVRDNGAGFNMAYAGKLFGTFERLHSPSDFTGTGVGLAIVKRVIDRHGGRVWGESEEGKGAVFYFVLPAQKGDNGD